MILQQLVQEIENKGNGELEQGRYLKQLRVLMQLRNLEKTSIKNMALTVYSQNHQTFDSGNRSALIPSPQFFQFMEERATNTPIF